MGYGWQILAADGKTEMGPALLGACSHLKSQEQDHSHHSHPSACRDPNFPTTGAWRALQPAGVSSGLRPGAPPLEALLGSGIVSLLRCRKAGKGHYMKPLSSPHPFIGVLANL